jgi:hypothetical protein
MPAASGTELCVYLTGTVIETFTASSNELSNYSSYDKSLSSLGLCSADTNEFGAVRGKGICKGN